MDNYIIMPTQIYIFDGHIIAARTGVLPREVLLYLIAQGQCFMHFGMSAKLQLG